MKSGYEPGIMNEIRSTFYDKPDSAGIGWADTKHSLIKIIPRNYMLVCALLVLQSGINQAF